MNRRSPEQLFANEVIRASAGTGKTFALSNRYLRLLASGVDCETILATTFTRKGAGEILDRIVQRLAAAALDPADAQALATQLQMPLIQTDAQLLLRRLMQQLHRLQIGTLDAFFFRIAQAFRLELGLPTQWDIAEEQRLELLQNQVIHQILHHKNVIDLLHLMTKGEAGRRVADLIRATVEDLYLIYIESNEAAWSRLPPPQNWVPNRDFTDEIEQLQNLEYPHGTQRKQVLKELQLVEAQDWLKLAASSVFNAIAEGTNRYYKPIPDQCIQTYKSLIEHCRGFVLDMLIKKNLSTFGLLREFGSVLESEKNECGELRFDDITRRLETFIVGKDTDGFSFRLDHNVDHLLLDEFQDTSISQWQVIKPFALRTTEDDTKKSFFCVGDLKQAIFGWRGGVAEIFDLVDQQLTNMTPAEPLTTSYRSSPIVIDSVNRVFQNLGRFKSKDPDVNLAVGQWAERFEEHQTTRDDLPGYCQLEYASNNGSKEDFIRNESVLEATVQRIATLVSESPDRSIGVLVRKNESIGKLIFMLQDAGIAASEEGGNPLTDSAAVETLLSAMTLADHPGDSVARFHLSHGPLAAELGLQAEHKKNQSVNSSAAHLAAANLRTNLAVLGYGATLEKLARTLAPNCTRRELIRLQQLVQEGFNYEKSSDQVQFKLRSSHFVAHIRKEFRASDESSAAVRVMTIHQSKGLEFDVVLLPLLYSTRGWFTHHNEVVVGRSQPTAPIDLVCRMTNEKLRALLPPEFQEAFDEGRRREVRDNLCVLYVAMTRAVHATHVIMSYSCKPNHLSSAGVLLSTLVPQWKKEDRDEGTVFSIGNKHWYRDLPPVRDTPSGDAHDSFYVPDNATISKIPLRREIASGRGIQRLTPSDLRDGETVAMNSIFSSLSNVQPQLRGQALHACLERIQWLESKTPSDAQFNTEFKTRLQFAVPGFDDTEATITQFKVMLGRPELNAMLTEASYRAQQARVLDLDAVTWQLEVQNERAFATTLNGRFVQGTIDRLVLIHENGQLVAADIVDFKSDRFAVENASENLKRLAERYTPQLQTYRNALSRVLQLPLNMITAKLFFLHNDVSFSVWPATDKSTQRHQSAPAAPPKAMFQAKTQKQFWVDD